LGEEIKKLQQQCIALSEEVGFDEVEDAGAVEFL
jgi:hypothetical protein